MSQLNYIICIYLFNRVNLIVLSTYLNVVHDLSDWWCSSGLEWLLHILREHISARYESPVAKNLNVQWNFTSAGMLFRKLVFVFEIRGGILFKT